jgi:hypothetical protein
VYRGFEALSGIISRSHVTIGGGDAVTSQANTVACPNSTTFVEGTCAILGNPPGSFSSAKWDEGTKKVVNFIQNNIKTPVILDKEKINWTLTKTLPFLSATFHWWVMTKSVKLPTAGLKLFVSPKNFAQSTVLLKTLK